MYIYIYTYIYIHMVVREGRVTSAGRGDPSPSRAPPILRPAGIWPTLMR